MSDNKSGASSGGIGVSGLLGVVFVVLKLTHYIDWSWLWVLSPFWIPAGIVIGIIGIVFLFSYIINR